MSLHHRALRLAATATALLGAGCASGSTSTSTARPVPTTQLTARLDNEPTGAVKLGFDAKTVRITVHLQVSGLGAGSAHAVDLHHGSCLARTADAVAAFPDIAADATGTATADLASTTEVPKGIPQDVYVELHLGGRAALGSPADPQSIPIACTDVPNKAPTSSLALFPTPGHRPYGTATLTIDGTRRSISVHLTAAVLEPKSVHEVDVDAGSCAAQGAMRFALKDITADDGGSAELSQVLGNVAHLPLPAGSYVVIRQGSTSAIASSGRQSPFFQPVLCGALGPKP